MGRNSIKLDLALCEVFNHLTPMKAGVLFKAVANYCLTGEVAPWGADADLKPIFMMMRANIERRSQSAREWIMKRWHGNDTNNTNDTIVRLVSEQETESETESETEKRTKKEKEKEKERLKENLSEKKR